MKMQITKDQAFRAVVAKWEAKAKGKPSGGIKIDDFTIGELYFKCGYCEYYRMKPNELGSIDEDSIEECCNCPLVIAGKMCTNAGHPFNIYAHAYSADKKDAAKNVLNLMLETKEKHCNHD